MTKVSIASDLHLEFADVELPGGDVLILAGDIWLSRYLRKPETDQAKEKHKRFKRFATVEMAKYWRVLMVTGNHESYGDVIEEMDGVIRAFLAKHAPNARLLNNEVEEIDGVAFLGTPLWATCGAGKRKAALQIQNSLNDFFQIRTRKPEDGDWNALQKGDARTFTPHDANNLHLEAVEWLKAELPKHRHCVVIGHHAPSLMSANGDRYGTSHLDPAYCSNLHHLMAANPQVAIWVHGHTHKEERYTVNQTRVIANPRGYFPDEGRSRHFDPCAADFAIEEICGKAAA